MMRFSAILAAALYLCLSIGVHVDVDLCCERIAGLSFLADADHDTIIKDDCCTSEQSKPSCCTVHPNPGKEGCPSDCVFIQVLQDSPQTTTQSDLIPQVLDIDLVHQELLNLRCEEQRIEGHTDYDPPPLIAQEEDLYLYHSSYLTYA